ncbi:MAG: hypothetical protein K2O58_06305, partial [Bacteroidales bacterium]|nr:hypothetical protein [Bacteroidales bacterium]
MKSSLLAIGLLCSIMASAQVSPVHKGRTSSRIILTSSEKADSVSAMLLQDFFQRISGVTVPVVYGEQIRKAPSRG